MKSISAGELERRLDSGAAPFVLDVREPEELVDDGFIAGSVNIPMDEFDRRLEEIPNDREIVVYCHGGSRSAMVAGYLEHHGFASVANLSGGIEAWSVDVDPKVPRYR